MPSRTGMSLRLLWETGWNSSLPNIRWVSGSFLRPCPLRGGVSCPSPFFLLTLWSCSKTLWNLPNFLLLLLLRPHLCSCLSRVSHIFTFKSHLIPQCGETLHRAICHTYHYRLMQKKQVSCLRMRGWYWNYFSRSGLDQMRALLALETFSYPFFYFVKVKSQIWDEDQSTSEVVLVLFFRSVYRVSLHLLTHVKCQSCVSIDWFLVCLETSYSAEGFLMSLCPYNKYH